MLAHATRRWHASHASKRWLNGMHGWHAASAWPCRTWPAVTAGMPAPAANCLEHCYRPSATTGRQTGRWRGAAPAAAAAAAAGSQLLACGPLPQACTGGLQGSALRGRSGGRDPGGEGVADNGDSLSLNLSAA